MFFKKRSIKTSPKNLNFARLSPSFVLVVGLVLSYQLWYLAYDAAENELQQKFDFQVQEVESLIKQRLLAYTQVLHGARGLYIASDFVNRDEFKRYVKELQLEKFYPGILGVAYAVIVPVEQKEAHLTKFRQEGFPNYKIYPAGEPEEFYTSIIYIEPFAERNQRAFGYDMYSESVRRTAMQRARDNNTAAMSGKITLVQETEQDIQAGFIIYLPQFRREASISTLGERRNQVVGWHYTVFRMNDLIHGIFGNRFKSLYINIYDSVISKDTLMYSGHDARHEQVEPLFKEIKRFEIEGHTWLLEMSSHPKFETLLDLRRSELIAIGGIGGSLMMSWIIWLLVNGRKRALQAAQKMTLELSEREIRYRQMFEDNSCASILIHPQTCNIIGANLAASNFWGYSQNQLSSMKMSQINHMAPEKMHTHFNKTLKGSQQFQTQHHLKNGELREVEVYAGPITYQGETVIYAIFHDITARTLAEKALQESTARWEFAIEGSGDGVWDWNVSTGEVIFSRCLIEMLGYREDEINAHISELQKRVHPDDKPKVEADVADYFSGKTLSYINEHRLLCKDGSWKWILDRGMIVRHDDKGNALRVVGTHTDISLQKETETVLHEAKISAIQANKAKSEFIANMSHEIRTPMNAIIGFTGLMRREELTQKQSNWLIKISESANHLLSLINDILDISKIEAGKLTLENVDFHLDAIFDHITSMLREQAKEKELTFEIDLDSVPEWLRGDPTRIRQALLNLGTNAVKFSEQGEISLRATKIQEQGDEILVRFEVQDCGIGIEPNKLSSLFQAFEQIDASTTRKFGGTGLGLAITRYLADMMGGEAGVESELGKGSAFWFTAKLTRGLGIPGVRETTNRITDAETVLRTQYAGSRILLVEDNAINSEVALELMRGLGLIIDLAENGQQAILKTAEFDYDLILMDLQMPVMGGLEATQLIRAMPSKSEMPILAMTANIFVEDREACGNAGMNDFIAKPVDPEKLYLALIQWLKKREHTESELLSEPANMTANVVEAEGCGYLHQQLAAINEIDVELGLNRLHGDEELYLRLLRQFDSHHGNDMDVLKQHLSKNQFKEALLIIHTLKGTAGTLGLTQLQSYSLKLEENLKNYTGKEDNNEINILINRVSTEQCAIHLALAHISEERVAIQETEADPAQGLVVLERLNGLLNIADTDVNNVFLESKELLINLYGEAAKDLGQKIEDFDYQEALNILQMISSINK